MTKSRRKTEERYYEERQTEGEGEVEDEDDGEGDSGG
jgi:hypothetical protein